jgi:hypothetical protein
MNNIFGTLFTFAGSAVLLSFGLIYLLRKQFMPYHKIAVQKDWNEFVPEVQTLFLALMRTVAGGFISVAAVGIILQIEFNKSQNHGIALTILIAGVLMELNILYATLLVRIKTKGRPPIFLSLLAFIMLLTGYFFNISG